MHARDVQAYSINVLASRDVESAAVVVAERDVRRAHLRLGLAGRNG
jgi:hypothetical protein